MGNVVQNAETYRLAPDGKIYRYEYHHRNPRYEFPHRYPRIPKRHPKPKKKRYIHNFPKDNQCNTCHPGENYNLFDFLKPRLPKGHLIKDLQDPNLMPGQGNVISKI